MFFGYNGHRPHYHCHCHPRRGCGCGCLPALLLAFSLIFTLLFLFGVLGWSAQAAAAPEAKETVEAAYMLDCEGELRCEQGAELSEPGYLCDEMTFFYDQTGVAPYVVIRRTVNGTASPTADEREAFADARAEEIFAGRDADTPALLLAALPDGEARTVYLYRYRPAADGEPAEEILKPLLGYLRETAPADFESPDELLAYAFQEASFAAWQPEEYDEDFDAEAYFYEPYDTRSDTTETFGLFLFPSVIWIAVLTGAVIFARKRGAGAKQNTRHPTAQQPVRPVQQPARPGERRPGDAAYPTARPAAPPKSAAPNDYDRCRYPITCPGCRATAYPNKDGTCQYCGRRLI